MTAVAYRNDLEQQFSQLPGWLQAPLSGIYHEIDGWLKAVAGNPQELLHAGQEYAALAAQIQRIGQEQRADRARLAGQWEGQAYDAFSTAMSQLETQIQGLAQATASTQQVLDAAAQACTEGADAICQIFGALISWLITSFVVNAVLAIFTFGAALAAEVAEAVSGALASLAQVVQVSEKVAAVLERVAEILDQLAETLTKLRDALTAFFKFEMKTSDGGANPLKLVSPWGRANPMDAAFPGGVDSQAGWGWQAIFKAGQLGGKFGVPFGARKALGYGTGGAVNIPGPGYELWNAGQSAKGAIDSAHQAVHEAG